MQRELSQRAKWVKEFADCTSKLGNRTVSEPWHYAASTFVNATGCAMQRWRPWFMRFASAGNLNFFVSFRAQHKIGQVRYALVRNGNCGNSFVGSKLREQGVTK
jgi:hypothetical protein